MALTLLTATACDFGGVDPDDPKTVTITGSVMAAGSALETGQAAIGDKTASVSEGTFSLEITTDKLVETAAGKIFLIAVTAEGYAPGFAKAEYNEDKTEYDVLVKLLPVSYEITEDDNIANGITIDKFGADVGKITIPQASFPDGVTAISGTITYLDPTTELASAPGGDLQAVRAENADTVIQLESFGMMKFDLKDQNGTPVTTLKNSGATVRMQVPEDLTAAAGETIPLWWYNAETGLWTEEGSGTVSADGKWIEGTVAHFTWWNYDQPIIFSGTGTDH
ncbi:MAG: hypothetical protein GY754_28520 [bacterium]|nr:hypothetical protein [bacterium]